MNLTNAGAEVFAPEGVDVYAALERTTHLGISAHQDDIELMAYHGIARCFGREDAHFGAVIVTNGSGSPRADLYADYSDEDMMKIRRTEQKKAAIVGDYSLAALLDYPSSSVKDAANKSVIADIRALLQAAKPRVIYTHNLADKHDTHVAVALRTIEAIRQLQPETQPKEVYGCEVWRGLDWLNDQDKTVFDVSEHENLAAAVMGVFDSQISGGKRYDLAAIGRRRANATFFESHGVDESDALSFAMDLTPLVSDEDRDIAAYVQEYVTRFAQDVADRIARFA